MAFFFGCFRSYLFVRAPFEEQLKLFAGEARPGTIVEVWARSVQCVPRGVRYFFLNREWIRRFPEFYF